jgi:thiol-disulfide isomerase/thioredoxin
MLTLFTEFRLNLDFTTLSIVKTLFIGFQWCGPCRLLAPKLEKLAQESETSVKVLKVDCDELGELAAEFQVQVEQVCECILTGNVRESLGIKYSFIAIG